MKILYYTFRTCPFKDKIPDAFVFGKLKEDLIAFIEKIRSEKPDIIMGIAKSGNSSYFERIAINQFNNAKKISKDGKEFYELSLPKNPIFAVSNNSTDSFCNWTAYKIADFLENNGLNTRLRFIHLREEDLGRLGFSK